MTFVSSLCVHSLGFPTPPFVAAHDFHNESKKAPLREGRPGAAGREAGPYLGRAARPGSFPPEPLPAHSSRARPPSPVVAAAAARPAAHLELVRGRLRQRRTSGRREAGRAGQRRGRGTSGQAGGARSRAGGRLAAGRRRAAGGEPAGPHPRGLPGRGGQACREAGVLDSGRGRLALRGARRWGAERTPGKKRAGRGEAVAARALGAGQEAASSAPGWRALLFEITREGHPGRWETASPRPFPHTHGPGALPSFLRHQQRLLRSFLKSDGEERSQPPASPAVRSALLSPLSWALDLARLSPGWSWLSQEPPDCLPLLPTSQYTHTSPTLQQVPSEEFSERSSCKSRSQGGGRKLWGLEPNRWSKIPLHSPTEHVTSSLEKGTTH